MLKINNDATFTKAKMGIHILIRNHLGVHIFAKAVPRQVSFLVDYGELLSIIEGYILGQPYSKKLIVENDSLLAVKNLSASLLIFMNWELWRLIS